MNRVFIVATVLVFAAIGWVFLSSLERLPAPAFAASSTRPPPVAALPTPTLGLDYAATAQVALEAASQSNAAALRAQQEAAAAMVEAKRLELSIQEEKGRNLEREARSFEARASLVAAENQRRAIDVTLMVQQVAMTAQAPTALVAFAKAQAESETYTARAWADVLVPLMLSAAVLTFALGLVFYLLRRPVAEETGESEEVVPVAPVYIQQAQTTLRRQPPGDPEKFRQWGLRALSGSSLAYNAMVGADKPYATNQEYSPVWAWACETRVAERANGTGVLALSALGRAWVEAWLDANPIVSAPLCPGVDSTQKTGPDSHAHENHGHDYGGGVA